MRILRTDLVDRATLSEDDTQWLYNFLDCAVGAEALPKVLAQHGVHASRTYRFEMAQLRPALKMMVRGVYINPTELMALLEDLDELHRRLTKHLDTLAEIVWGKELNPRSPKQLKEFFYGVMGLPEQYTYIKGKKTVSTNRECLEKLMGYFYAQPIVQAILGIRETEKKIQVFVTKKKRTTGLRIDDTGRFRTSMNVGGTETGRWSSSRHAFGGGTNLMNITEELRRVFVADPGMCFCNADLRQAESFGVAYRAGDEDYIAACESGDLHTYVARLLWPDIAWTGDLKRDKDIADDSKYYRHFSYRDMAKRAGHLTNYKGTPFTLARILKISQKIAEEFQELYFDRFRRIPEWHKFVARQLQTASKIETMMGREILFFDRVWDDATLREAIAADPQSTIADVLNLGLCRIERALDNPGRFELLLQVYDSILFQFDEKHPELVQQAAELMKVDVPVGERTMQIPVEVKVGYTWRKGDMRDLGAPMLPRPSVNLLDSIIE